MDDAFSEQNRGQSSDKSALEKKLKALKDEVEITERELTQQVIGEMVIQLLNQSDEAKALLSQVSDSFEFELIWDNDQEKFRPGKIKTAPQVEIMQGKFVGHGSGEKRVRKSWNPLGPRPPQEHDYYVPILQALKKLGWAATPRQITPLVFEKVRSRLSEEDLEWIPSGMFIRWECRMRFARKWMTDEKPPLLNPNSARGVWEATEAGQNYLEDYESGNN